jgi:4-carboxymuconolactone decarboxylase
MGPPRLGVLGWELVSNAATPGRTQDRAGLGPAHGGIDMADSEKLEAGKDLARKLFAGAPAGGGGRFPKKFNDYTMEHLFGDVWQQDDMTLEERSLITCTILVALGRENEQKVHFTGAKNLGIPREKVEGMITQAAHYAGWPCAATALGVLNQVWPVE